METTGAGRSGGAEQGLETFLSGMETPRNRARRYACPVLETFLSGMETSPQAKAALELYPLKPSLVEWKQIHRFTPYPGAAALETFLSGMETAFHVKQVRRER